MEHGSSVPKLLNIAVNFVEELLKLIGPVRTVENPPYHAWETVEAAIGFKFPADFRQLVSALGTGRFGVGLYLRNPTASSDYIRLSKDELLRFRELMDHLARGTGLALFPERGGLISVGGIDRQLFLLRPIPAEARVEGLVWWDTDSDSAKELPMTISQFIHDLYLGRIHEEWAVRLQQYFWRNGTAPLFTPSSADRA